MQNLMVESHMPEIATFQSALVLTSEAVLSQSARSQFPMVTLDMMTPSDSMSGVDGTICYGVHPTPFGELLIAVTPQGICNLHFVKADEDGEQFLRSRWKNALITHDLFATQKISKRLFSREKTEDESPLPLWIKGTDFQIQVWRALLTVPFGQVTTYQEIANAIGKPTATRAVGNAIGRNPIAYLIPCHRVIRESGALGGYYWGLERKTAILQWEARFLVA